MRESLLLPCAQGLVDVLVFAVKSKGIDEAKMQAMLLDATSSSVQMQLNRLLSKRTAPDAPGV